MGVYNTNTFAGSAGSAWPAASNGDVWTYTNFGNAYSVAPSDTVNGANVGEDLATANATLGNFSGRIFRVGSTTHSDSQVTCVIKRSDVSQPNSTTTAGSCRPGVILRKLPTTAQTYYVAMIDYYGIASKGGTTYVGGIRIWKYNGGTASTLVTATAGMTDLGVASNSFVIQFRVTNAPNTTSGALLQARAWTGSNPATPPAGAEWTSESGVINSAANYVSCAYLDTAPLAAGTGGLWAMRYGGTAASTISYSQYEYRTVASQSASTATTETATFSRRYAWTRAISTTITGTTTFARNIWNTIAAGISSAPTISRNVGLTLAGSIVTSAIFALAANVTAYAITLSTSISGIPTIVRSHARTLAGTIAETITIVRATMYRRTMTATTTLARTISRNVGLALGIVQTVALTITRTGAYQRTIAAITMPAPTIALRAAYYRTLEISTTLVVSVRRRFSRTISTITTISPTMIAHRVAALIVQHLRGPLMALVGTRRSDATIVAPPETTVDVQTTGGTVEVLD